MKQSADHSAFVELVDETRGLFHRLRHTAEAIHHDAAISAGQRAILESLQREGALTVPAMARARPVSRQHVQTLVNELLDRGYVELADNPAHKRSRLVRLTAAGREVVRAIERRERRIIDRLEAPVSAEEMRAAASVLRTLRDSLAAMAPTQT